MTVVSNLIEKSSSPEAIMSGVPLPSLISIIREGTGTSAIVVLLSA